jgi:hypothetical protein
MTRRKRIDRACVGCGLLFRQAGYAGTLAIVFGHPFALIMRRALEGLISSLISPPDSQAARVRSPVRLEQLWSRLQDCTFRYRQGIEGQQRRICEVLQEITELVVWGDQNSSRSNSDVSRLIAMCFVTNNPSYFPYPPQLRQCCCGHVYRDQRSNGH